MGATSLASSLSLRDLADEGEEDASLTNVRVLLGVMDVLVFVGTATGCELVSDQPKQEAKQKVEARKQQAKKQVKAKGEQAAQEVKEKLETGQEDLEQKVDALSVQA